MFHRDIQTSFCDVNTNKASSGLRENAILIAFGTKNMVGNMVPNYAKRVLRYKEETPLEWT